MAKTEALQGTLTSQMITNVATPLRSQPLQPDGAAPISIPTGQPVQPKKDLGWVAAGFILFAFAAPSAAQSAPYFIGMCGFLGGTLLVIVLSLGSAAGSWMLLQVKMEFPSSQSFGELGENVLGTPGKIWGNLIQIGNFLLFLPCALRFCAEALQGIGHGIAAFDSKDGPCFDYYMFVIALICLLTTQARTLGNTTIFSLISLLSVCAMAVVQLWAAFNYDVQNKMPGQWFGNPGNHALVKFCAGATIPIFGYVPSFLTTELSTCMSNPKSMNNSLALSCVLNIVLMLGVGIPVVACWGYNMGSVIGLTGQFAGKGTAQVDAWTAGNLTTTILNVFALSGNFVSYMLDSVPLGRYCQQVWAPHFGDTWSPSDILKYLGYTLPTFVLGVLLSVFFPSLEFLIDAVTFLTTPWVTMIYPAVLYWKVFRKVQLREALAQCAEPRPEMSPAEGFFVASVFLLGCIAFVISATGGIGKLVVNGLSGWSIGCTGWYILSPEA